MQWGWGGGCVISSLSISEMVFEVAGVHHELEDEDGGQVIYWPSCKHASMQDCLPINKKCCVPHQYDINLLAPTESSVCVGGGTSWVRGCGKASRPQC